MFRLTRAAICVLAILFAASGVRKVTAADAGPMRMALGSIRIAFGSVVCVGALRALVRGRPVEPRPPEPA